jgi:hypothetical protein
MTIGELEEALALKKPAVPAAAASANDKVKATLTGLNGSMKTEGMRLPSVAEEINAVNASFSPRTITTPLTGTPNAMALLESFQGDASGKDAPEALAGIVVKEVLDKTPNISARDLAQEVWARVMPVLTAAAVARGENVQNNIVWAEANLNRVTAVVRAEIENRLVEAVDVTALLDKGADPELKAAVEAQLRTVLAGNRSKVLFCAQNMTPEEMRMQLPSTIDRGVPMVGNSSAEGKIDAARVKQQAAAKWGSVFLRIYTDDMNRLTNLEAAVAAILQIFKDKPVQAVLSITDILAVKVVNIQA